MTTFPLYQNHHLASLFIEEVAFPGVKRVAKTVSKDIHAVTGQTPELISTLNPADTTPLIFIATLSKSSLLTEKASPFSDEPEVLRALTVKRECFLLRASVCRLNGGVERPVLFIIGSDKRGTIYGLFYLSRMCGISPLVFFGDAEPVKKEELLLPFKGDFISKEPSVRYRGFFINDEWPAYGKWTTETYGGQNASSYEKIFELLLRLNGNYLWPAMWRSSFWEDGPGLANASLADEYGVILGTSHHEPMIRAGVEWQNQYRQYGTDNTWSFISNREAITSFWLDGLRRGGSFENVITIGMRGENDSVLLSKDATLKDNIQLLKDAIQTQHRLISAEVNKDLSKVPRMLAIYKEVEDFFFGEEGCPGLKDYEELADVIFLLSDDNYGNLRALPEKVTETNKTDFHKGGYGMYYHFDYHGAPFSYEWINGTNLSKVWEQMTLAYEHNVREMWIVNVGDIKGNELALSYFLTLAYDFETYGSENENSSEQFLSEWLIAQFPLASDEQRRSIQSLLVSLSHISKLRLPEALQPSLFRMNFHELSRFEKKLLSLLTEAAKLRSDLPKEHLTAYESMVYFYLCASVNNILLNLSAGKNEFLAENGFLSANAVLPELSARIASDRKYVSEFHAFRNGKWKHMMDSAHTGFRNWDDNNYTYPSGRSVYPLTRGKIAIGFAGSEQINLGFHWQDREPLRNEELTRPSQNEITLVIYSRSDIDFSYKVSVSEEWLSASETEGVSELSKKPEIPLRLTLNRSLLSGQKTARITISFTFSTGDTSLAFADVVAGTFMECKGKEFSGAYLESEHYICIPADGFVRNTPAAGTMFLVSKELGREGAAIFCRPGNTSSAALPSVEYRFVASKEKDYTLCFYLSPRNPVIKGNNITGRFRLNDGAVTSFEVLPKDYYAEWYCKEWSFGVTNNLRLVKLTVPVHKGLNSLTFYGTEETIILNHFLLSPVGLPLPDAFFALPVSDRLD